MNKVYLLPDRKSINFLILFAVLFISATVIIFSTDTLPLYDYPSHIARQFILKLDGSDPVIAQYFSIDWHYVPNLAIDLFSYPLLSFFEVDTIGRIFICCSFLLMASGTIFLHRTLGGKGYWPYIAFLFLFNDILLFGFLSFLFSISLVPWCFALWVKSREKLSGYHLAFFALLAMFLLTCHLFAFCLYALLVGSYEIGALIERYKGGEALISKSFIIGIVQFIPSIFIFFILSETSSVKTFSASSIMMKLSGIASVISLYNIKLQISLVLSGILVLGFLWRKKILLIAPRMYIYFILSILFFLIAPFGLIGTSFLDYRMPVAFLFPVIASIQIKSSKANGVISFLALLGVCLIQYIYISTQWSKFNHIYDDMFEITRELKAGDKLLHVTLGTKSFSDNLAPPLIRLPEYLLIRKRVITPFVFAIKGQQPIKYNVFRGEDYHVKPLIYPSNSDIIQKFRSDLETSLPQYFDYLLLIHFDKNYLDSSDKWKLATEKGIFKLYKKQNEKNNPQEMN